MSSFFEEESTPPGKARGARRAASAPRAAGARARRVPKDSMRGKVRPHDPFELIRWLALSQPDPRKALAELVQNSLDANAKRIRVSRVRERGVACLKIVDDGAGVIPELDRAKALEYIATHIGHSRKHSLSPQERFQLMTQGQYGIGLLGFWSLGHRLEIRSSVPGQMPRRLVLHKDDPNYEIEPLRGRLGFDDHATEVVVVGLHREAMNVLGARRAADYLAAELRGQLLARDVDLIVEDRMARGLAPKAVPVRPRRFLGDRITRLDQVEVPGHPPIRLEIYFSGDADATSEASGLAVYGGGTLVADSFHQMSAFSLDRAPWTDTRLTGIVDWPGFHVAPGSRRGVALDAAGEAFAHALREVEPVLVELLESIEKRRAADLDRNTVRELQRAFREFYRRRPRYSMLPVNDARDPALGPRDAEAPSNAGAGNGAGASGTTETPAPVAPDLADEPPGVPELALVPSGPLARVEIRPARVVVECNATKTVRASAFDAAGEMILDGVTFEWQLDGALAHLEGESIAGGRGTAVIHANGEPGTTLLQVTARDAFGTALAEVPVELREDFEGAGAAEGVPEPEFVDQPGAPWRSRMVEHRWQVNAGHPDYQAATERPALKLRYLAMLFAKEVVLRSAQDPRLDAPLEQLVEVASFADWNLIMQGGRGRGARRRGAGTALDTAGDAPDR